MLFRQFYLGCLAHASYLVGSDGEAAIVDPQRDVDHYLDVAAREGLTIRYVIETHLHADFVSGHRELAARSGAEIVIGADAGAAFPHRAVRDGDVARSGRPTSPMKSVSPVSTFTGRPSSTTSHDMVWPAHGAGSACGRNISTETSTTIGMQRRMNYALQPMTRDTFVAMMTTDLPPAPPYFSRDAEMNRVGARPLADVMAAGPLPCDGVMEELNRGALPLDVRDAAQFAARHVDGAINVGLDGQFASWCGTILPHDAPLVVIAENAARAREAIMRLARVGIESVSGYLVGTEGLPCLPTTRITVDELASVILSEAKDLCHETRATQPEVLRFAQDDVAVVDVRRPAEYEAGHVAGGTSAWIAAGLPTV